ncbi:hypothetical protein [Nitrococcus mobilis]|uniref:Uncharacterized protein n=1 Tax=Nitrococcus mobilis Nb-231 TaxID=314278 RepID=A4BNB6_9GAMM|nr:hypothetical protein [Nitrococcus mobilis]EAR22715.1 hypothetical protein NB231_09693 [Nitrococcus mobilis Nb-231]
MEGKTLRGRFDHFEDRKAAQVLSALATKSLFIAFDVPENGKMRKQSLAQ